MKKAAWYLVLTLAILFMASAVFIYAAPHLRWQVSAVVSGSMEPALKTGSLVVVRPAEPEEVKIGDIITFYPVTIGELPITHRVTGIGESTPIYFETKGDANANPDPFSVPARNLIGINSLHIPYIGYFTVFLDTTAGFITAIIVPAVILFILYVMSVVKAFGEWRKQRVGQTLRVAEAE
ncbi:signal peptidase I [Chloroflexota bacterium]